MRIKTLQLKKTAFAVLVGLLLSVAGVTKAFAQTFTVGNLNYSVNDDGVSVTVTGHVDGRNATGELVIPESVEYYGNSYPVTKIRESAFSYCPGLTGSLVIPNSVITIERYAFEYDSGLTGSLTIGNSVQYIGDCSFRGCGFTGSLTISGSVTTIGNDAFQCGFTGLITIPENIQNIGRLVFSGCNFTTLNYNAINCYIAEEEWGHWLEGCSSLTTVNIGENVHVIPNIFLYGCSNLTGELVIPETVTYIGENAFNGCSGFSGSLTVPNSVTSIGANAFSGCGSLSGILTLGSSLTEIGNNAFFGACEDFTSLNVLTETPPTLGANVFSSVEYGIPVTVPCGKLEAYQNASGWSQFTNIQEPNPCLWDITATANPVEGGTVSGAGTYEQGTTCTLTATPKTGASFVKWTEDGVEVSTEAQYSFTVTENRYLVAHFMIPTYTINVIVNPSDGGSVAYDGGGEFVPCDFEDGSIPAKLDNSISSYPWTIWSSNAHYGSYCMASNNPNVDGSESAIETTVEFVEDGSISFWWRISSENNYDKGFFYINGVEQFNYSGSYGWNNYSIGLSAGTYTFRWSYQKDENQSSNEDRFFIDDITFTGAVREYQIGQTCTLTATPSSSDFVFLNWTENSSVVSTNALYSFTITNDRNLVANFNQIGCEITASSDPETMGTVSGGGHYTVGQTCTLTATPNEGYSFVNWTEGGEVVSTNMTYSFTATTHRNLVAHFRPSNAIFFLDPNVETICLNNWDTDSDGYLSYDEAAAVSNLGDVFQGNNTITSFNELQYFTGLTSINGYEFWNCNNLASVVIPTGVTSIGEGAFGANNPMSLNLTYNATNCSLNEYWLYNCALTNLVIGDNVQIIPDNFIPNQSNLVGTLHIPASVTSIGGSAFANCRGFTGTLTIPASVTSIGSSAFANCTGLTGTLVIPESVTTIGNSAFYNCTGLTGTLTIPASVTSIEAAAFKNCTGLVALDYNAVDCNFDFYHNEDTYEGYYNSYGNHPFDGCLLASVTLGEGVISIPNNFIRTFMSISGSLIIPNSITRIGDGAFGNCAFTGALVIPENVTYIGRHAFRDCTGFTGALIIPDSVETIGYGAFYNCTGFESLVIGKGVQWFGNNTFGNLTNLESLTYNAISSTIEYWSNDRNFSNNPNLTSLSIGDEVEVLPDAIFDGASALSGELVIPNSLIEIQACAFMGCSGLTGNLVIPDAVTLIEYESFMGCTGFETLTIGEGVDFIGQSAFWGCSNLTTLNYNSVSCSNVEAGQNWYSNPEGEWISNEGSPFAICSNLTTIVFGQNVENIPYRTFYLCNGLTGPLTIPNSLITIGDQAFYNCYGLEGVEMSNAVETIGAEAFRNCGGLRGELTLPETLQSVGNYAFASCDELTTINYNAVNCTAMGNAQQPVFYDCASMAHIKIGENVESIPNYAFKRCSTVTDMTVAATVPPTIGSSTFGTLQRSIPVTVQCEATAAYQAAQYWNEFTNYNEGFNYVLEVTCDPERGTVVVNKMADCDDPTARVTAYPEIGYAFLGWSENGTLVSEANPYTFTMESSRELQAEFIPGVSYSVTVTVVPAAAGTVTGQGNYNDGSAVTLTATTNPGYAFVNWTENGSVVSTDEEYTFTIHANRNLVANFTPYSYHWDVNIHQYPGNMTAIGVIQIDGVEQTTPTLEIGAFCNDECRGRQLLTYYPQVDRYMVFLMLYGEDGDEMSFKLYDHVLEQELTLSCTSLVTFAANTALGNPVNPYVFNFINSQQTPLAEGWTWYSTYIEQEDIEGLQMMTEALNESGVMIKSQTGFIANSGGQWMGNLDEITNESMYMVNTTAATLLDMVGNSAIASQHPITMNPGWNWIGYPMATANSVSVALSDLEAQPNDVLKSQESFATYYEGMGWFGSLNTITPGMGLMYDSKNDAPVTFTYTEGRSGELKRNVTAESNHWVPDMHKYTNNMNVMAVVELDDVELRDSRYELAVFAGNECRGSVRLVYVEPIDRYVAFLTVAGREATDLQFVLFDADENREYGNSKESLVFESDAVVGNTKSMMTVHFASCEQENDWSKIAVYPNPADGGEHFSIVLPAASDQKVRVEIINELGAVVSVAQSSSLPMEMKAPATPGLYTLKIVAEGNAVCFRKLVVK